MSVNTGDAVAFKSSSAVRPRRFFVLFALALLLVVFVGFAPSFYLRGLIDFPGSQLPPPPVYVYIHGTLMTSWYLLFTMQSGLVATGRRAVHKAMGVATVLVATAIVATGWYTNQLAASRIASLTGLTPDRLIELVGFDAGLLRGALALGLFASCVAAAVLLRKRVATHGRLMLLASVAAAGAALAPTRILGAMAGTVLPTWLLGESLFTAAAVTVLAAYDWRTLGRIHAATMIVGSLLLLLVPLASALAATAAGQRWYLGLFESG